MVERSLYITACGSIVLAVKPAILTVEGWDLCPILNSPPERRCAMRSRWQADAHRLMREDERGAYEWRLSSSVAPGGSAADRGEGRRSRCASSRP